MSTSTQKTYRLNRGAAFFAPWPGRVFGAASAMAEEITIDPQLDEQSLTDYESRAGGTAAYLALIKEVKVTISLANLNADNLARHLGAGVSNAAAEPTVTDTFAAIELGSMYPYSRIPSGAIVAKKGIDTLVEGTDYLQAGHGGIITLTGGQLIAGDTIVVTYAAAASRTFEAILTTAGEVRMRFAGVNVATGKKNVIDLHKLRVPPGSFALISKEFDKVKISAVALRDDTVQGDDLSKYFNVQEEV